MTNKVKLRKIGQVMMIEKKSVMCEMIPLLYCRFTSVLHCHFFSDVVIPNFLKFLGDNDMSPLRLKLSCFF